MGAKPNHALQASARRVYLFAQEVVRFRFETETRYADALPRRRHAVPGATEEDAEGLLAESDALVDGAIRERCDQLVAAADELGSRGGDRTALDVVSHAARAMRDTFVEHWRSAEHEARLEARLHEEGRCEFETRDTLHFMTLVRPVIVPALPDWPESWSDQTGADGEEAARHPESARPPGVVPLSRAELERQTERTARFRPGRSSGDGESPCGPAAWEAYGAAVTAFAESLDEPCRPFFRLGTRLAGVRYPLPSSNDENTNDLPANDGDALVSGAKRAIDEAIGDIRNGAGLLTNLRLWPHDPTFGNVRSWLLDLEAEVAQALEEVERLAPRPGRDPGRPVASNPGGPRWDPVPDPVTKKRTLYFRERPVRQFVQQAKVVVWLDEFQNGNWATSVEVPRARVRHVLATLNKDLTEIEFYETGERGKIGWGEKHKSDPGQ